MQYLLSKEEYSNLILASTRMSKDSEDTINELCRFAADNVPVHRTWDTKNTSPWGCIHTVASDNYRGYCDECPVEDYCKMSKDFSK